MVTIYKTGVFIPLYTSGGGQKANDIMYPLATDEGIESPMENAVSLLETIPIPYLTRYAPGSDNANVKDLATQKDSISNILDLQTL